MPVSMRCDERFEKKGSHAEPSQATPAQLERAADSGEGEKHGENGARSASGDDEAEDDAASAVSWATVEEDTVAAESGAEGRSGGGKNDRPRRAKVCKQSASPASRARQYQEPAPPCQEREGGGGKKRDDVPHGHDALQTSYDKHLSSSAKQEKSVKALEEDVTKHPEPFIYSRQQSMPESRQQHGGASQQRASE
ncbi:hypothetical protein MRX96_015036, partial [Rhipicephalus microplus]